MCKPILLIGMMGCGKSTIGRLLAGRMGLPLIDLDEEIARAAGRSIPEIFAEEGDAGFRLHETAALGRALNAGEAVIATGGGIVTREKNIRMMREKGVVVWLCRPLEDMIADVRQDTRPNLAGDKEKRKSRCTHSGRTCMKRRLICNSTIACRPEKRRRCWKSC